MSAAEFSSERGLMGRSIHDAPERSRSEIRDDAVERAHAEVVSYLEGGYAEIEDLIPMLDGDGLTLLCKVLHAAYRDGRRRAGYSDAEALVDALAEAEADREAQA